jgi:hypothetical protein
MLYNDALIRKDFMTAKDPAMDLNSEADRNAVRDQLDLILKDRLFLNSKLYPLFLRYVVRQTLDGQTGQLKERTIGVEVFGRDLDYDTDLDSVVRVTAGKVRKRLAQYYQDPQHSSEVIIDLPSGSYVAQFHHPVEEPEPVSLKSVPKRRILRWAIPMIAGLAIAGAVYALTKQRAPETALDKFWAPVVQSQHPILLCTGTAQSLARQVANMKDYKVSVALTEDSLRLVTLGEAQALMNFSWLLKSKAKSYRFRDDHSVTLADLKDAPVILIGALNNIWTLRFVASLRFSIRIDPDSHNLWIADRENQGRRNWLRDNSVPADKVTEDFALISRFKDPTTGQYVVVSAGLHRFGTVAASEFLSDSSLIAELDSVAPRGWENQNLQVVIATRVFERSGGRPRIVATHFW